MIANLVYVICNSCLNPCGGLDGMRNTVKEARHAAWERGWEQRADQDGEVIDLCEECKLRPLKPAARKPLGSDKGAVTVTVDPRSPSGFREVPA